MNISDKMKEALAELFFRNPQRHDGHAYEPDLVGWALGIKRDRPDPTEFGQDVLDVNEINNFIASMRELYELEGDDGQ